ncbi:hypothetical protein TNCV_3288161 [Trichonephila clavipes]|nr:hypothetical protein TNCV_3288161 [Trichonephila clavipes]
MADTAVATPLLLGLTNSKSNKIMLRNSSRRRERYHFYPCKSHLTEISTMRFYSTVKSTQGKFSCLVVLKLKTILDSVLGARAAGVHYRLFSVWTLVPLRLGKQLFDHSTVDEIASKAADCRHTYTMANCPQRR